MSDDPLDFSTLGPCTPGDAEWQRRMDLFMADPTPWSWWWLSFVDTAAPYSTPEPGGTSDRFLGICIVAAPNVVAASQAAWALGCNPGGQVAGYPAVPPGWQPKTAAVGRLFRGADAQRLSDAPLEEWAEPEVAQ